MEITPQRVLFIESTITVIGIAVLIAALILTIFGFLPYIVMGILFGIVFVSFAVVMIIVRRYMKKHTVGRSKK